MCKICGGCCLVSAIATWGFFAVLLNALNAVRPGLNALWLTLLVSVAMVCCPVINQKIVECCTCGTKTKKKKK